MYYFSVPYNNSPGKQARETIGIYLQGNTQALLQMSDEFKEMATNQRGPRLTADPLTADKRYHFFPQLNLLLTIPPTNDKIVARSLDVRHLLDEKGIDYLYVTSSAPLGKVSASYRYKMDAVSKAGGVKFKLQSGPEGLTVSGEGEVAWKTPDQPADETVIVSMKDASGREMLNTFHVVTTK
jgi:hypothetical protein